MKSENSLAELYEAVNTKSAIIGVVGLGQVGLPTAFAFLQAGFSVIGYDKNRDLVKNLNSCISHIPEENFSKLLDKFISSNNFLVTSDPRNLSRCSIIVICVATPLDEQKLSVELRQLIQAVKEVAEQLNNLKLIIIESTLPPLTMKEIIIPTIEETSSKMCGSGYLIAYCPERIAPGNALREFSENDRLVGVEDSNSADICTRVLSYVTKGKLHVSTLTSAEISKLAENTYRDVNIAFANELSLICEKYGSDVRQVIKLANTHPRVNIHTPGPGVGGPCLPKDPYLLLTRFDDPHSIVRTARKINDSMPQHVIILLKQHLERAVQSYHELKVLVLGSSYKPNVNDSRYSPTKTLVSLLKAAGFVDINVSDPHCNDSFGENYIPVTSLEHNLSSSDIVIIMTGHSAYAALNPSYFKRNCIIIDCVRILRGTEFKESGMTLVTM